MKENTIPSPEREPMHDFNRHVGAIEMREQTELEVKEIIVFQERYPGIFSEQLQKDTNDSLKGGE